MGYYLHHPVPEMVDHDHLLGSGFDSGSGSGSEIDSGSGSGSEIDGSGSGSGLDYQNETFDCCDGILAFVL